MSDSTDTLAEVVGDNLVRVLGNGAAGEVFSPPQQVGERVIITAAAVERAGGFGFGGGAGSEGDESGEGSGGGGGGTSSARPVAVIDAGPDGVIVRPIVDVTRLLILVVTTFLAWRRLARRRR
jgi:uncharacterized spore protein YtfJ